MIPQIKMWRFLFEGFYLHLSSMKRIRFSRNEWFKPFVASYTINCVHVATCDSQEYCSRDFLLRSLAICYLRIRNYFKNRAPDRVSFSSHVILHAILEFSDFSTLVLFALGFFRYPSPLRYSPSFATVAFRRSRLSRRFGIRTSFLP